MLFAFTVTSFLIGPWLAQATLVDSLTPPTLLRTQMPSITHEFNDILWKRQQTPQVRISTATQPQLALSWPLAATWSSLSQPIQLIANCPPISTGFVAIAISTILAFNDQLNFVTLFILLSAVFSFVAGILELVNLITTEASPNGKSRNTAIATAAFLAGGVLFKYVYLFFRFEPAMSNRASIVSSLSSLSRQDTLSPTSSSMWATPSWDGLGPFSIVLKIFVLVLILIVTVLETVWRIGIVSAPLNFLQFLRASSALQMLLLLILTAKTVYSGLMYKSSASGVFSTVKELGPVLIGNGVGFATQIMDLEITAFTETPLGRYMILIQVYFYIIDAAIHCARSEFNRRSVLQFTQTTNPDTKAVFALSLRSGSSFGPIGPMDELRDSRLISLGTDSPTAPAFKSLPDAPVFPEISTLTRLTLDRTTFNLQNNFQGIFMGENLVSPETRLSRDIAVNFSPHTTQPPQPPILHRSNTSPEFGDGERPSQSDLLFSTTLDDSQAPIIRARNSTPNYNARDARLSPHSMPDGQGSKVVDDLGPLNFIPASTIFSKYYMGAYEEEVPPPLPTFNMLNTHDGKPDSQIEATAAASEPLPPSSFPLFPHQAAQPALRSSDRSSIISASIEYSSLPSSSFSSVFHEDGHDRLSWGNSSSASVELPVPLHLKDSDTISSALYDMRGEGVVDTSADFFALQPDSSNLGAAPIKPQELVKPITPLVISKSEGTYNSPFGGNFQLTPTARRPVSEQIETYEPEEADPRSGRQGGSQIDVTSFIDGLTTMEDANRNRLLEPLQFPQSPKLDSLLLNELRLSRASTMFTASPTSSIQIIDLMGHPIIRDPESLSNLSTPSPTQYFTNQNEFITLEESEEVIDQESQTIVSPTYQLDPDLLAILPTHLSNSSLFQTSEIFEHPRPAPLPNSKPSEEDLL